VAAVTAYRVEPTAGTALPGDEPRTIAPAAAERASPSARTSATLGSDRPATSASPRVIEVVVDGWRFELAVEDAARADLRRRATRDRDASNASGPTEIRAIIPGRVAAVHVAAGDGVEAGQGLLVVEAMKMQNELRAARAGVVERVAVAAGETIELGDLLVVIR
jgi:biotin carboxyl carrier protein